MKPLTREQSDRLESLVDSTSLGAIVFALVEICNLKGEHISANWQDEATAKQWLRGAKAVDSIVDRVNRIGV